VAVCDVSLTAAELLAEIRRLYRQLRTLPCFDRPESGGKGRRGSAEYLALETEIRTLADRYSKISGAGSGSASHASTSAAEPHAVAGT